MLIVFEGCDKTGKTTLAKLSSQILRIPYFKRKGPDKLNEGHPLRCFYELDYLAQMINDTNMDLILDRGWLSEIVYGKVFNRKILEKEMREIDNKLKNNAIIFLITADKYTIKDRLKKKKEDIDFLTNIEVQREYMKEIRTMKCINYLINNNNSKDINNVVEEILSVLK